MESATGTGFKIGTGIILAFILVPILGMFGCVAMVGFLGSSGRRAAAETAAAATKPAQSNDTQITASIGACKTWTAAHSKLGVDWFTREFEITGRKLPPHHYRVGVDYRAKGNGLMMASACEYKEVGDKLLLVKAETGLHK